MTAESMTFCRTSGERPTRSSSASPVSTPPVAECATKIIESRIGDGFISPAQYLIHTITGIRRQLHCVSASSSGCIQDLFDGDQFGRLEQTHAFRFGEMTDEPLIHELLNLFFNKRQRKVELDGQLGLARRALALQMVTSQDHQHAQGQSFSKRVSALLPGQM